VHSAYYAGRDGGREERDARNNKKLLLNLSEHRKAYYYCILILVQRPDDPRPLIAEGLWRGEIARTPRGENGFGYDPLFYVPALGRTAAELDSAEKNRLSHRGQALQKLLDELNRS
jgi:XTP/dITP diphosphohydrolase